MSWSALSLRVAHTPGEKLRSSRIDFIFFNAAIGLLFLRRANRELLG